jgi:threonine/homoserine/homoserine lactone efflux protein
VIDWLAAAGLGLGLGAVMGMPIGVVNMTVADAAVANRVRFAIGIGLGGALADAIQSSIAFAGIGHLDRQWTLALSIVLAGAIAIYAVFAWRRHARPPAADHSSLARGIPTGLLMTLPNPAVLGVWLAIAAALPAQPQPFVVGAGVGIGAAAWFTVVARYVAKRRDHPVARALPRIALVVLVGIAITTAVRAGCS